MRHRLPWTAGLAAALLLGAGAAARAELLLSANDGKGILVNGVNTVPDNPVPDSVSIVDLGAIPPKVIAEIEMPTSLVGPPSSVAIACDESFALVTATTRRRAAPPAAFRPPKLCSRNGRSIATSSHLTPSGVMAGGTGDGSRPARMDRCLFVSISANSPVRMRYKYS